MNKPLIPREREGNSSNDEYLVAACARYLRATREEEAVLQAVIQDHAALAAVVRHVAGRLNLNRVLNQ